MNRLDGLMEFLAVVEMGSFSRAADKLDASVAQISRRVVILEERLGAKLFVRTTRSVKLTDAGNQLAQQSRPLLEELSRVQDHVLKTNELVEGPIRLSMDGYFSTQDLAPIFSAFCERHPRVRLVIELSNSDTHLLNGYVDFALRAGPLEHTSALVARPLSTVPMVTLIRHELLYQLERRLGAPLSPLTIPEEYCLSLSGWTWRFRKEQQVHAIQPSGPLSSNHPQVLITAAMEGAGVVQVPANYTSLVPKSADLVPTFTDWVSLDSVDFNIVYAHNRFMPSRVRLLINQLLSAGLYHQKIEKISPPISVSML